MNDKHLKFDLNHRYVAAFVSLVVGAYGLYIIATTLLDQFQSHRFHLISSFIIDEHLLFGLGFVYLSTLLLRYKRNALYVAIGAFTFLLVEGLVELFTHPFKRHASVLILARYIVMPVIVMAILATTQNEFQVKSDTTAFRNSVRLALIAIVITLGYGVGGYLLMDNSDFHQEIGFTSALHHTVDQFDLTTNSPLTPYTRRARIFQDSLSFVSVAAVVYLAISLFQPVRARLSADQNENRSRLKSLLEKFGAPSEEFFKLWPHDKHYFFSRDGNAALAYNVRRGIALVLSDPVGDKAAYKALFRQFSDMCWANDWQPALIHVDERYADFYRDLGFQIQLIGQEAMVDIKRFSEETVRNKYFRNIKNRFTKGGFSVEVLSPPYHPALINRLREISDDWLNKPGRVERGFVMGYFSEEYMQQCQVAVVRDAAQTILAFLNLVPSSSFNKHEATYDLLRSASSAAPNINDFLLIELIERLKNEGYRQLSLGLSPLVGIDNDEESNALIRSVLRYAFVNGDKIYSFSGLHRFKEKYEPKWTDRYLAYKGGVRGFTRMLNALNLAMKVRLSLSR